MTDEQGVDAEQWWDSLSLEERESVLDDLFYWEGELEFGWDDDSIDRDYDELNYIAQDDIDRAYERYGERTTE